MVGSWTDPAAGALLGQGVRPFPHYSPARWQAARETDSPAGWRFPALSDSGGDSTAGAVGPPSFRPLVLLKAANRILS